MEAFVFWVFAILAVIGAGLLIFHKNPVNSALSLIMTLFCTASLFVLLHAGFVAVLQVLVYAGAIMVLFLFVIMMLNLQRESLGLRRNAFKKALAAIIALALGVKMAMIMGAQTLPRPELNAWFGSVERVGALLFTEYLLPFEALSVLLLAAIVGAVMVAKTRV